MPAGPKRTAASRAANAGALRLNGPSLEIVERCDEKHTVSEIISELQKIYSKADPSKVEQDILSYLVLLQNERALDFE
jgi:hypothetical protein